MTGVPTVGEVRSWLQLAPTSLTDDQLQVVIDGELAGQAASCRVPPDPADYPDQLREALYRRVGRVTSGRQVPMGLSSDIGSEYGASRVPSYDPEIERIEGPFRVVVFG